MKTLPKAVLTLYLLVLVWLVLFKFSYDIYSVILHYQMRSLNLIPFSSSSGGNALEMIENIIVFIPFGLLLGVNFKLTSFWQKLATVFIFSLAVEILQYIFAIGVTDTTDVITNTFGGFVGLVLYDLSKMYSDNEKLDRFITVTIGVLLMMLILLRVLVFQVRY